MYDQGTTGGNVMKDSTPTIFGRLSVVLLVGALLAGCGSGKEPGEKVSGKVLFGKKPLPSGTVSFIPEGKGGGVAASQIASGRYSLEVPKGKYRITVTTPAKAGSPPDGTPDSQNVKKLRTVEIPARYGDFGNSGLDIVVKKGPQTHDISLKPDPPPPPPPEASADPAAPANPPPPPPPAPSEEKSSGESKPEAPKPEASGQPPAAGN